MDGYEIDLLLLSLFIVSEDGLSKFLLLRRTKFKQVDTCFRVRVRVRVSVRVLRRYCCSFGFLMLFSPFLELGILLLDYSQVLIQDFSLWGTLAEEIDLMLKAFVGKCLFNSLGLYKSFMLVQDKALVSVAWHIG